MKMTIEDLPNEVTKVSLDGRLDIPGAQAIDLHWNVIVGSRRAIVVDLAQVSFIASMGLRTLVMGAKTVASKRGRIVLLSPDANVETVLLSAGIDSLIPIHRSEADALAAVSAQG